MGKKPSSFLRRCIKSFLQIVLLLHDKKALNKSGAGQMFLNTAKAVYIKLLVNIPLKGKADDITSKMRNKTRVFTLPVFNRNLKVLPRPFREERWINQDYFEIPPYTCQND